MTTEQVMRRLFPPKVIQEAKSEVQKAVAKEAKRAENEAKKSSKKEG
jgi:hypothetical protein